MKRIILAASLISNFAFADSIKVFETQLLGSDASTDKVVTKIKIDPVTGEGKVAINLERLIFEDMRDYLTINCSPYGCTPFDWTYSSGRFREAVVYSQVVGVEGLSLHGNRIVYSGKSGDVECGVVKPSRFLKIPKIRLNGNCEVSGKLLKDGILSVSLITK